MAGGHPIGVACLGDETLVGWQQVFYTAQEGSQIAQWVEPANEQNPDRLQAEVQGAYK